MEQTAITQVCFAGGAGGNPISGDTSGQGGAFSLGGGGGGNTNAVIANNGNAAFATGGTGAVGITTGVGGGTGAASGTVKFPIDVPDTTNLDFK